MKRWLCVCVLTLSMVAAGLGICQQNASSLRSVQGIVSEVDSVGSLLVILTNNNSDQVRFTVDSGAKIQQGTDNIFLEDVEQGDPVTVKYYESPDGTLRTPMIIDSNVAGDF